MRMKKWKLLISLFLIACLLTGCGDKSVEVNTTTIVVKEDGTVETIIVEDFDKPYYSSEELKADIEKEVKDYNYERLEALITVKNVEIQEATVRVTMEYKTYKDYVEFNQVEFYSGTVKGAMDEGYLFDQNFVKTDGSEVILAEVTDNVDNKIIVCNEGTDIIIDGKIIFVSDNVKINDKNSVTVTSGTSSYIIYK